MAVRAALNASSSLSPTLPGGRIGGQGGYHGGQSDHRSMKGWRAKTKTANADSAKRGTLIARSRDAAMNMPLATAAIDRRVTFVVGTGMMAIPQLDAERIGLDEEAAALLTAQIMRDYDRYMSSKDPDAERAATGYEHQEVVLRGQLESGDILGVRLMPEGQVGRVHPLAWKLVEADRIASPTSHVEGDVWSKTGNALVQGIELDGYGAAVAFHVITQVRGVSGTFARRAGDTKRIVAWGEKSGLPTAVLVMRKKRPEQARGIPVLAPVIETLKQVSDLTTSEAYAAVLTAMLAIVYKSPGAGPMPEADYGTGEIVTADERPETLADQRSNYRMEPGSVMEIDTDAEVDVKSPGRPNPAFDPFFQALAGQIGAAMETPREVLMLAFESSYTASKGALEAFYKMVVREQSSLGCHWCDPHYQAWFYVQVALGRYPAINQVKFFADAEYRALCW
ncbi:MAG: phage portal protein, partial [Lysobacteraceae bacterium]